MKTTSSYDPKLTNKRLDKSNINISNSIKLATNTITIEQQGQSRPFPTRTICTVKLDIAESNVVFLRNNYASATQEHRWGNGIVQNKMAHRNSKKAMIFIIYRKENIYFSKIESSEELSLENSDYLSTR